MSEIRKLPEEKRDSFVVTINKMFTREKMEKLGLNERQIKGFEYIEENDSITSIPKRTTRKDLSVKIEKIGEEVIMKLNKSRFVQLLCNYCAIFAWRTTDMVKECLDYGLPEPEFEEISGSLVVTFWKSRLTEELMNKLELNDRQKRAIGYLKEHDKITTKEYCGMFNVVKNTANRDLNELLDKDLIKRKGSGPKTHYVLSTVRYRSIPFDKGGHEK